MRKFVRFLLCWAGFHVWDLEPFKVLYMGGRKGRGKNREIREWRVGQRRVGCFYCDWAPAAEDWADDEEDGAEPDPKDATIVWDLVHFRTYSRGGQGPCGCYTCKELRRLRQERSERKNKAHS